MLFTWNVGGAHALTEGPNNPGTTESDNSAGSNTWSDHANAQTQNDTEATSSITTPGDTTEYLKVTNFGFDLPDNATIDGIVVEVDRYESGGNAEDEAVRIVKGGTIGSTDKSAAGDWSTSDSDTYTSYGSSTDLWGESWTVSDIESSTFGFALRAEATNTGAATASVDHIRITIHYTTPEAVPEFSTWAMLFLFCGVIYVLHKEQFLNFERYS